MTVAARARAQRLARRRRTSTPHVPDPCPLCAADLGAPGQVTRRVVAFTPQAGVFRWQCPECTGVWEEVKDRPLTS